MTEEGHAELDARQAEFAPFIHLLSGKTREHWEAHCKALTLTTKELYRARDLRGLTVQEKLLRVLRKLAERSKFPGDSVRLRLASDYPLALCKNQQEMFYHLKCLRDTGYIELISTSSGSDCTVTPDGWAKLEEGPPDLASRTKAFVAMWFTAQMDAAYEQGIRPAIVAAGYDPVRLDRVEHADKIDDRIVAEIRESRFIVADFTGQRGGVYFEAGFALGLGIPVIWTCREEELPKVHFDTSHFNYILWKTPQELGQKLEARVRRVVGLGPRARRPSERGSGGSENARRGEAPARG